MFILDTSFLVALFNVSDELHKKAVKKQKELRGKQLLLPEYVVLELTTVLAKRVSMQVSQKTVEALLTTKEISFIICSDIFLATLTRFYKQRKFKLSFVDCALLELKSKHKASIVTFDADIDKGEN